MSASKQEILESISEMSVMDLVELISDMEEKFGVSAVASVAPAVAGPVPAGGEVEEEEQTEFSVLLESLGEKKVTTIKVVRSVTGLGLKEAKDLVESIPAVVKEGIPREEAEAIGKQLEEAGAGFKIQ